MLILLDIVLHQTEWSDDDKLIKRPFLKLKTMYCTTFEFFLNEKRAENPISMFFRPPCMHRWAQNCILCTEEYSTVEYTKVLGCFPQGLQQNNK